MSNSVRPHRWQPTRLPRPWDSPGKNTGMGCHFLLQCVKVKSESEVAQSCPTLSDPMDCSLPGSSAHGIFQARVLEWGAIAFSTISMCPVVFVLFVYCFSYPLLYTFLEWLTLPQHLECVWRSMANWWTMEGVIIIVSIVALTYLKNFLFLDFLGQTMNKMYRIHFVFCIINIQFLCKHYFHIT